MRDPTRDDPLRGADPAPLIRRELAARAMQGAIAATAGQDDFTDPKVIAEYSVGCADALLAELAKPAAEEPCAHVWEHKIAAGHLADPVEHVTVCKLCGAEAGLEGDGDA